MDFEGRWSFYGEGRYIGCQGTFFIWVVSISLLHYIRKFVKVEITWPFEPSKGRYVDYMLLFYNIGYNMLCTYSFIPINFVCVYFLAPISFSHAWLCEPWIPPGVVMCHIKIIYICALDCIKWDSYGYHSMVASTHSWYFLHVWEWIVNVFHELESPCSNLPS